jgi:hypothetical protein
MSRHTILTRVLFADFEGNFFSELRIEGPVPECAAEGKIRLQYHGGIGHDAGRVGSDCEFGQDGVE